MSTCPFSEIQKEPYPVRLRMAVASVALLVFAADGTVACNYSRYGFKPGDKDQADVDGLFRGIYEERKHFKTKEWRAEARDAAASATDIPGKLDHAWALHMANEGEQALAIYREILKAEPDHYEALCSYATVLHEMKQYQPARDALTKAASLKPGFRQSAEEYHLAMIDYEEKVRRDYRYAREHLFLDDLTPYWKNHQGVEQNLSTVELPGEYTSDGLAELLRQFPRFGDGWLVMGMLLEHEKKFSMAAKAYDRALENGTAHAGDLKKYMATFREFGRSMDPARVGGRRLVQLIIGIVVLLVLAWLLKVVSRVVSDITSARAAKEEAKRRERRKHKDPDAPL